MNRDDALTFVQSLAHELATQDNRGTADPYFVVQEKRLTFWVLESESDSGPHWYNYRDCEDADEDEAKQLEAHFQDTGKRRAGWNRIFAKEHWETVESFLSCKAAEDYIRSNGHNHRELRTYAESAYRNSEIRQLRAAIAELGANP